MGTRGAEHVLSSHWPRRPMPPESSSAEGVPPPQVPMGPLPYGSGQEGVESVQPVVHVLVTVGLQEDATVLRAHSKRVGRLKSVAA